MREYDQWRSFVVAGSNGSPPKKCNFCRSNFFKGTLQNGVVLGVFVWKFQSFPSQTCFLSSSLLLLCCTVWLVFDKHEASITITDPLLIRPPVRQPPPSSLGLKHRLATWVSVVTRLSSSLSRPPFSLCRSTPLLDCSFSLLRLAPYSVVGLSSSFCSSQSNFSFLWNLYTSYCWVRIMYVLPLSCSSPFNFQVLCV